MQKVKTSFITDVCRCGKEVNTDDVFICGKRIFLVVASWELKLQLLHWPKSDIMAIQIHH
jgi:hypothetical protein